MRTVRNLTFVLLVVCFIGASERGAFGSSGWQYWAFQHDCFLTPDGAFLDGYCSCHAEGCGEVEDFCDSWAGACDDYCWMNQCAEAVPTTCQPGPAYVACQCDYCT
jgi:hypothetical protein